MTRRSHDGDHSPVIAVTGIGAISAAGGDAESLWQAAIDQQINAVWVEGEGSNRVAGYVATLPDSVAGVRSSDFRRSDRFAQLGIIAGRQAWLDAGILKHSVDPRRVAVVSGTSRGPATVHYPDRNDERERSVPRIRPTAAVYSSISSLAGTLADLVGARGPTLTVSATCASSAVALSMAAMQIASGVCDVAVAGGADAPFHRDLIAEMQATGVIGIGDDPRRVCRPFDRRRTGIAIGEAGAYLVLENLENATARGARIRALLTGWSSTCDPGRRSGMSEDSRGLSDALEGAMHSADCEAANIGAIHLHGTGTPLNDVAEAIVIRRLLGPRAKTLPCTSTKPITGHCLGASGALQAVINVRALEEQRLPPTANCEQLDPDCDIAIVRYEPWQGPLESILTHSAGFWGNHAGLIFRRA